MRKSDDELIRGLMSLDQYSRLASLTLLGEDNGLSMVQQKAVFPLLKCDDVAVKIEAIMVLGIKGSAEAIVPLRDVVAEWNSLYVGCALVSLARLGDSMFVKSQLKKIQGSQDEAMRFSIPEIKKALRQSREIHPFCDESILENLNIDWISRDFTKWEGQLRIKSHSIKIRINGVESIDRLCLQHQLSLEKLKQFTEEPLWPQVHALISPERFSSPVHSLECLQSFTIDQIILPAPNRGISFAIAFSLVALEDEGTDVELFWFDDRFVSLEDDLIAEDPFWQKTVMNY